MAPETTTTATSERLLRLVDVLDLAKISKPHWYRLIARGQAPRPVHLGRTTRWRASEISAWIASLGER